MKIKKLKILTLFLMAFFAFGCVDNQKEKTKPAPAPAPKPPVVEPTTEPATEPFKISIADIKDYYGFGLIYSKIHLTDKDGNIIKTKVLDNQPKKPDEYISQFEFKDLAVKEYKLCLQIYEINRITQDANNEPQILDNVCDFWLTETNEKSANTNLTDDKNQAQIINTNLLANLVLPKNLSIIIKGLGKKTVELFINTDANKSHAFFVGYKNNINYYQKVDLKNPKVVICNIDVIVNNYNFTCLNKDNSFKKHTIVGSTSQEPALNPATVNYFLNTLDKFNLNDIEEINF